MQVIHSSWATNACMLAFIGVLQACNDGVLGREKPQLAAAVTLPSVAPPGAVLLDSVRVLVAAEGGEPVRGHPVWWRVLRGQGSLNRDTSMTDSSGIAAISWTLGSRPGINEIAASTIDGAQVRFAVLGQAFIAQQVDADRTGTACGLLDGDIWCWGDAEVSSGRVSATFPAPGLYLEGKDIVQITTSWRSFCGRGRSGEVWCGGYGYTGGPEFSPGGVQLTSLPPLQTIAGGVDGGDTYCGLTVADSTAWCWSSNTVAPVGNSPKLLDIHLQDNTATPGWCGRLVDSTAVCGVLNGAVAPVPGGHKFFSLVAGETSACGIDMTGTVWCWGDNTYGQLGVVGPSSDTPVRVISGVSRIAILAGYVAVLRYGVVERWGPDALAGEFAIPSLRELPVTEFAGDRFGCVVLSDGQVYCNEKIFLNTSVILPDLYLPVHPLVTEVP